MSHGKCTKCGSVEQVLQSCPIIDCYNCGLKIHISKYCLKLLIFRKFGQLGHGQLECSNSHNHAQSSRGARGEYQREIKGAKKEGNRGRGHH